MFRYLSHNLTWHCSSISEDLRRFARNLQYMKAKVLLFLNNFRTTSPKNSNKYYFAFICCKFLANLCKSSEILEQCYVKWWLNCRKYGSVSYSFSCMRPFGGEVLSSIFAKIWGKDCPLTPSWFRRPWACCDAGDMLSRLKSEKSESR